MAFRSRNMGPILRRQFQMRQFGHALDIFDGYFGRHFGSGLDP